MDDFLKDLDKMLQEFPKARKKLVETQGEILHKKVLNNINQLNSRTGNLKKGCEKKMGSGGGYVAIRANYAVAPHSHLLENGHNSRNGGWVQGRHMYKNALSDLEDEIIKDAENIYNELGDYLN